MENSASFFFFSLSKKEPVALTKTVPFKPVVLAETLQACALIGLHASAAEGEAGPSGSQSPDFGDMWRHSLCNFKFVAFTDIYGVWSGRHLLFPKSEPDLTVDLNSCVIDASSKCGLSLATRVTVEPAGHSGACH